MLHYARRLLGRLTGPTILTSVAPPTQSASGTLASWTFSPCTVTVTGDTVTNYSWGFTDDGSSGNWSVTAGAGSATATPRVATVGSLEVATADFQCTVTLTSGGTRTAGCAMQYTRTA